MKTLVVFQKRVFLKNNQCHTLDYVVGEIGVNQVRSVRTDGQTEPSTGTFYLGIKLRNP